MKSYFEATPCFCPARQTLSSCVDLHEKHHCGSYNANWYFVEQDFEQSSTSKTKRSASESLGFDKKKCSVPQQKRNQKNKTKIACETLIGLKASNLNGFY
jgi:hypothetical protein